MGRRRVIDSYKVKIRITRKFGRGIFAVKKIRKGELIASFDGPFYDHLDEWDDDMFNHAIQYGRNKWRDSKGIARLINHSCEPNCGIKRRFDIVAMRDIQVGEQVTWDYEMTEKNPWFRMRCKCGAPTCRRVIGDYRRMPKVVREKYKGYISSWLL